MTPPSRVVLIEDSPSDARLIRELLREGSSRFEVVHVATLRAALEALAGAKFDVVLADLALPDTQGVVTVERILEAASETPVVVLTGIDDEAVALQAVHAGAQDFLVKGRFDHELLSRTLRYAIERKRAEEHARRLLAAEAARNEAARARERAELLAAASDALAATLDLDEALAAVARLLVPRLGASCAIEVLEADGSARCATIARVPGVFAGVAEEPAERFELPLRARERVLGRVVFGRDPGAPGDRAEDPEELALAREVARRIALAIDNAMLIRDAQRATEEAQRAACAREELLAIVSHDLRNPLSVLGLAMANLRRALGPSNEGRSGALLERAENAYQRMLRMIDDLLDVATIDAGTLTVEPKPHAVGPLLAELVDAQRALAAAKSISLASEIDDPHALVLVDRDRFAQVFGNLVGNAIKFTPQSGAVRVVAARADRWIRFSVVDSGPGIPEESARQVFDRFWRARSGRSSAGLGLAIAKGIVESHGGAIGLESAVGRGSTFWFTIPCVIPCAEPVLLSAE